MSESGIPASALRRGRGIALTWVKRGERRRAVPARAATDAQQPRGGRITETIPLPGGLRHGGTVAVAAPRLIQINVSVLALWPHGRIGGGGT